MNTQEKLRWTDNPYSLEVKMPRALRINTEEKLRWTDNSYSLEVKMIEHSG